MGVTPRATSESCHEMITIAITDAITTATLDTMVLIVSVSTSWVLVTSLVRRDWISPVRVPAKNDTG